MNSMPKKSNIMTKEEIRKMLGGKKYEWEKDDIKKNNSEKK